ncbi:hypothetical protein [Thermotalea metallivorans]|uniref:Uncharacterized protein n=1 Tax=Thermotalea metallivorans TaxID=520762 RepID=A0A140KZG0_9FIRM|nr:hypothetical protein [Thermotalea metallivorans]KXG73685.1 hypothetical protein AN619_29800 [Thermotalea metallivorans]
MTTWVNFLLYFIEGFLMLGAGFGILGIRLSLQSMGLLSCLYSLLTYGVRQFYMIHKIPFGTHTFVILAVFILLIVVVGKQRVLDSIIALLVTLGLLFLGEGVFLFPILNFFKIDLLTITNNPLNFLLAGFFVYIPLVITFLIGYVFKITIIDFNSFKNVDRM